MGAPGSVLMAMMCLAPAQPAMCWMAPLMPQARYSSGVILVPVWPTCCLCGRQPSEVTTRDTPTTPPSSPASSSSGAKPSGPPTPRPPPTTTRAVASETPALATARVVVGGGRGVGGPDGFARLEELADLLGGVVGVSRVVTGEGWRPHKQQVGQTGTRITPEVYLACGISGAIQHMAGCAGARHIVVINTDPGAPILSHADYAVI